MVVDRVRSGGAPADASGEPHAPRARLRWGRLDISAAAKELRRLLTTHPLIQVVAPSGAGLSTLARELCDTPPPGVATAGLVAAYPRAYASRMRETVAEELALPLEQRGVPRAEMIRRVARELAATRLNDVARRDPSRLSGGQDRRLAVGAAAVQRPDLLVLDCAFDGLDSTSRAQLARRAAGYASGGRYVVVLAHTPVAELAEYAAPIVTPGWASVGGVAAGKSADRDAGSKAPLLRRYTDPGPVPVPEITRQCARLEAYRFPGITAAPGPGRPRTRGIRQRLQRLVNSRRSTRGPVRAGSRQDQPRGCSDRVAPPVGPLDLELYPGAVTWLRGPNGAGKTTVLRALAGLGLTPADTHGATVGLAVQEPAEQVVDSTVEKFVGDRGRCVRYGLDPDAHPLDLCGSDLRVAQLLSVASLGRDVFAADEPDVGLDWEGRRRTFEAFADVARHGAALLVTCHDPSFMSQVSRFLPVHSVTMTARPTG